MLRLNSKLLNSKISELSTDFMPWLLQISGAVAIIALKIFNPTLIPDFWFVLLLTVTLAVVLIGLFAPNKFRLLTKGVALANALAISYGFIFLLLMDTGNTKELLHTKFVFLLLITPLTFFGAISAFQRTRTSLIFTSIYYALILCISLYFFAGYGVSHADVFMQTTLSIALCILTAFIIIYYGSLQLLQNESDSKLRTIRELSFIDNVTNLANRAAYHQRLYEICQPNNKKLYGLILIDIDGFKAINDHYGTVIGDTCLKVIAKRLNKFVYEDLKFEQTKSLIARTDGDEFGLLLPIYHLTFISEYCQKLEKVLNQSIAIDDSRINIPVTISACQFPKDALEPHLLVQRLDWAMQEAKRSDKFCIYSSDLGTKMSYSDEIKAELSKAIERDEFEIYYQPLVNLETNRVESTEALLRWHNAKLGSVSPSDFIPLAEQSGLILPIGTWVLEASCNQLQKWLEAGYDIRIAVNISVAQFKSENFIDDLQSCIQRYELDASRLELEITESLAFGQTTFDRLYELQNLGYTVKLDDFGTGYSSLSVVSNLPLNTLKIDRAFVQDLNEHSDAKKWMMVKTIISLAQNFELEVVAEGVETQEQLSKLQELGCDYVQGYYISKPIPAGEFAQNFLIEPELVGKLQIMNSEIVLTSDIPTHN